MEQIEIEIDMKTETNVKKVMSKLRLRSMLKSMLKEGLITGYEVTHWSHVGDCGIGETVLTSAKAKEQVADEQVETVEEDGKEKEADT